MNVGEYFYFNNYLMNLIIYYNENVKKMSIKNRFAIMKEIETLEKKLKK